MKRLILLFVAVNLSVFQELNAQTTSINFELNGRLSNAELQDSLFGTNNPFARFIGEWTLKENIWIQNWGEGIDTILIPKHHTVSSQLNTDNSLLSIIDGPEPNGHIFWSFNPNSNEVSHLSSFGSVREGIGKGTVDSNGNLELKIRFEGEALGTYRIYTYTWLNDDEYDLLSIQYDEENKKTGLFYKGTFVRTDPEDQLRQEIYEVLEVLDNNMITKEQQIEVYTSDIVHMAPNHEAITNKAALLSFLRSQEEQVYTDMEHRIVDFSQYGNVVWMMGEVIGTFYPKSGDESIPFRTKNMFLFKRINGALKISKVIYNMSPPQ